MPEAVGGAEAGQIDRHRTASLSRQPVQRLAPGVGAVGVAVEHQERDSVPLELEYPSLVAGEFQTVFEEGLDHP